MEGHQADAFSSASASSSEIELMGSDYASASSSNLSSPSDPEQPIGMIIKASSSTTTWRLPNTASQQSHLREITKYLSEINKNEVLHIKHWRRSLSWVIVLKEKFADLHICNSVYQFNQRLLHDKV